MKYFKPSEFDSPDAPGSGRSMNLEFLSRLEAARALCQFPWRVTAGFRTASHNAKLKGASKSYHLTGEAADIACIDGIRRYLIVQAAMQAGIKGIEVCDRHVHLDNRSVPTLWPDKSR